MRRLFWLSFAALFAACGARTELPPGGLSPGAEDEPREDAGAQDAAPDRELDASADAPDDAPDAEPDSDVPPGCDAGDSSILLLTSPGDLYRFDPLAVSAAHIGRLSCAVSFNSMSVARTGRLYLNSDVGELYTADSTTLACEKTPFDASQVNFQRYGMGFAADEGASGETLFIAPRNDAGNVSKLSRIDLATFLVSDVGPLEAPVPAAEVKGTGDGRLYLVHMASQTASARLVEIDKDTAELGQAVELPVGWPFIAFDFAFWGGAFYVFATVQGEVDAGVLRYTPETGTIEELGRISPVVVGAGVSTCAPL